MKINIAIVDDIAINRATIKEKMAKTHTFNLLFEAENGLDFLDKLNTFDELPDVVLVDLEMPKMNGIETIFNGKIKSPNTKFIVLTVYEDSDKIFEAIKAGAHGYLLKEDSVTNIAEAINSVHLHNGIPMSPLIARKALQIMLGDNLVPVSNSENNILSTREKEILKALVAGKNYKKIGDELFISPHTVRKHVANIYEKLHINNKAQLINIAYEKKWI